MTGQKAGDRLARLLLPYLVRDHDDAEDPDHEVGWLFRAAPPKVVLEALKLVHIPPDGERPNDQPPEEWLVAQAECRGGGAGGVLSRPRIPPARGCGWTGSLSRSQKPTASPTRWQGCGRSIMVPAPLSIWPLWKGWAAAGHDRSCGPGLTGGSNPPGAADSKAPMGIANVVLARLKPAWHCRADRTGRSQSLASNSIAHRTDRLCWPTARYTDLVEASVVHQARAVPQVR
jgi:hypothetical protein